METKYIDIAAIFQTAKSVITSPAGFFRTMPKTGGFVMPLVFMAAMGLVSGVIGGALHALDQALGLHLYAGVPIGSVYLVLLPVLTAVGLVIFGFIGAGILFLIWKLMGSRQDYETAYRCGAYLAALFPITTLLGLLPYVGGAIGLLVILYYLVIASVEVHALPPARCWTVFGMLTALIMLFSVSSQIATRGFDRRKEQAAEEWQKAVGEMQKMQKQMQEEMEKQIPPASPSK